MRKVTLSLAALLMLLALGASTAAANQIEMTTEGEGGEITAESEEATFTNSEAGIGIRCHGTFRGRFEGTVTKTRGSHVGNYTFASAHECTSEGAAASVTFLGEGPWEARYESFSGTLPAISSVLANIAQLEFLIEATVLLLIRVACLYRAEAEALVRIEQEGMEYLAEAEARLVATLSAPCPESIALGGNYPFVSSAIRMRLF